MKCNLTREQNDELCASIIKRGIEITDKYMKEHSSGDISRTASSSSSTSGIRNEVYALRQRLFGHCLPKYATGTETESRTASSGSHTIGPNKIYELRRLLFERYG